MAIKRKGPESNARAAEKRNGPAQSARAAEKLMIFCFWAVLLCPNLLFPLFKGRIQETNTEKRELAKPPAFSWATISDYPSGVENYINDHAPFRNQFLDAYARLNLALFDSIDSKEVIKGREGWLFYTGNESVEDCLGTNLFKDYELAQVVNKLERLRDRYAGDKEFLFMIAPNKELVYDQYLPGTYRNFTGTSKARQLVEYIRANSDIRVIYPLELVREPAGERLLYYKTDSHWNDAGGFLAVQELIGASGGVKTELSEVRVNYLPCPAGDLGDLFHMPGDYVIDYEAEIVGYYDQAEPKVTDEEGGVIHVETTGAPDGRKLVMIRDSFAGGMIPSLIQYYGSSTFIDWQSAVPKVLEREDGDVFVHEIVERNLGRLLLDLDQFLGEQPKEKHG